MITSLMEKKEGIKILNNDIKTFKYFIKAANLIDVSSKSGDLTWNNKKGGDRQITSRLDRFLVTETILLVAITVESDILPNGGLDH